MRTFQILIVQLLVFGSLYAQNGVLKYDYQWPMGYPYDEEGNGVNVMDFNDGQVKILPSIQTNYEIGVYAGFINNAEGQLQLVTNGCVVTDANLELIENGYHLNPGEVYINYCNLGYPSIDGILMLPSFTNESLFNIVHKDLELSEYYQDVISNNFYVTRVEKGENDQYVVIEKNTSIFERPRGPGYLAAVPHQNLQSWWVVEPYGFDTDTFLLYQVFDDVVFGPRKTSIPPIKSLDMISGGSIVFSPQGEEMAMLHFDLGLLVYDFDRTTGTISNYRNYLMPVPASPDSSSISGLAFSSSGRLAYVTHRLDIFQVDLYTPDTASAVVHLLHLPPLFDDTGWPIKMGDMQLGPDCRIYISPRSTTNYLHVIHHPNIVGPGCGLELKAIKLENNVAHNFPIYPHYRTGQPGAPCDQTIEWIETTSIEEELQVPESVISVYPNPARDELFIDIRQSGEKIA